MASSLNLKSPRGDLTKEKINKFKKKFECYFMEKYLDYAEEAKLTGLWEWLSSERKVDKWKVINAATTYLGKVPVIGQAVRVIMPIINGSIALVAGYRHLLKSKKVSQTMNDILERVVQMVVKEVSYEAARIYEYQIGLLQKQHVEELAQHAVDCIFSYCAEVNVIFDRNHLLNHLANGKIPPHKDNKKLATINNINWKLFNVFKKPGLRKQYGNYDTQVREFKFFVNRNIDDDLGCGPFKKEQACCPQIYGFRSEIFSFDESQKLFIVSSSDECFKEIPEYSLEIEFHQQYLPIYITENEMDLSEYMKQLSENPSQPKPFSDFIKSLYDSDKDVIVSSHFNGFIDLPLNCGNFDSVEFIRVTFSPFIKIQNISFIDAKFLLCDFSNNILSNCKFNYAEFSHCNFKNSVISNCSFDQVVINNSNFDYCELPKDLNFRSALKDKSNNFKYAKFIHEPSSDFSYFKPMPQPYEPPPPYAIISGQGFCGDGIHCDSTVPRSIVREIAGDDVVDSSEDDDEPVIDIKDLLTATVESYQHYLDNLQGVSEEETNDEEIEDTHQNLETFI